jgi:stringent starvation protein B
MPTILPPKKDVALALLERASVFIHLDPRDATVQVPSWFKRQPQLVLQVGLNMLVRIPDLEVGEESISCTLSFNRAPHYCYVPWRAVYALVGEDGRGMVWPEDIPPEVAAQTQTLSPKPRLQSVPPPGSSVDAGPNSGRDVTPKSTGGAAAPVGAQSGGSRGSRFHAVGQADGKSSGPASASGQGGAGKRRDKSNRADSPASVRDAGSADNPPLLSLSGSKRRRAAGSRAADGARAQGDSVASGSSSDTLAVPDTGLGRSAASSSGDSRHVPDSSVDSQDQGASSQERSSRSSERPYLRLVR